MRATLERAAGHLQALLEPGEAFTAYLEAEQSDFVRLNGNRVRQAGHVSQARLNLDLIHGDRHVEAAVTLSGEPDTDAAALHSLLTALRRVLPLVPEDPYLAYAAEAVQSSDIRPGRLPEADAVLTSLSQDAAGLDLVGHWAAGNLYRGFAGSAGQWHWFEAESFSLDWSLYQRADKAVKGRYAGSHWDPDTQTARITATRDQLEIMARPAQRLLPGAYRVYLAPAAVAEILGVIAWQGLGLRALRTRQTPLLRLADREVSLHPGVELVEHCAGGQAPRFSPQGFTLPERLTLIQAGRFGECLVDARSSREYGVPVNAAAERPASLEMGPGDLDIGDAAALVGDGLLVSDLWYGNLSDRARCAVTGMTRYACLRVENGRTVAPVEPMRFDVSLYDLLGEGLLGLTRERELLTDTGTYEQRSTATALLPGILVRDFPLTL
jgi:predicted Zn-dependent protease